MPATSPCRRAARRGDRHRRTGLQACGEACHRAVLGQVPRFPGQLGGAHRADAGALFAEGEVCGDPFEALGHTRFALPRADAGHVLTADRAGPAEGRAPVRGTASQYASSWASRSESTGAS
ncbi:hypothetical protein [Streptomyces sp. NPDC001404]|uniref:hypothetical protein n=1 Tax=Streptomyces sp. NPDC001404 TaxID=3364571 RepID=UPI0036A6C4E0